MGYLLIWWCSRCTYNLAELQHTDTYMDTLRCLIGFPLTKMLQEVNNYWMEWVSLHRATIPMTRYLHNYFKWLELCTHSLLMATTDLKVYMSRHILLVAKQRAIPCMSCNLKWILMTCMLHQHAILLYNCLGAHADSTWCNRSRKVLTCALNSSIPSASYES